MNPPVVSIYDIIVLYSSTIEMRDARRPTVGANSGANVFKDVGRA